MAAVATGAETDHRDRPAIGSVSSHEPVHPRWTHAPLGGLVFAALFDVVSVAAGSTRPWARELYRAGTFVLLASLALAVVAIGTGLIDRGRTTRSGTVVRAHANVHGAVMAAMIAVSTGDLALRTLVYPDSRHTPAAVAAMTVAALAAALIGGDLGGRLTYRYAVAVQAPDHVRTSNGGGR